MPETMGGKMRRSVVGGQKESRSSTSQQTMMVPRMRPYAVLNESPSATSCVSSYYHKTLLRHKQVRCRRGYSDWFAQST